MPQSPVHGPPAPPKPQPRALSSHERARVLDVLHEPRFVDKAPRQVWAELLDDDEYFCSISTMYRLLAAARETRERRRQATHPATGQTGAGRDRTEPSVVVGHQQATRPGEVDLLLPVRRDRRVQPLRRRLDGRDP
jgi:hypothetical protein